MIKNIFIIILLINSGKLFSQYYVLEETNATYYYFHTQERLIERLFNKGLIHKNINLSPNSRIKRANLIYLTDSIRTKFLDCFSSYSFKSLFLENSLKNTILESRKTYFHIDSNGSINYLLQTRIIFEGQDVEVEKFEPKIKDIQILFDNKIIKLNKQTIKKALNPKMDDEFASLPPPPPPPMIEKGFTSNSTLTKKTIKDEITLLIPTEYMFLSKGIDEKNKLYYFEPKDQASSIEVRKFKKESFEKQKKITESARKLEGIEDINSYTINSNNLNLLIFEAVYFHKTSKEKKAWTKIFVEGVDTFWTVTIRYPLASKIETEKLREEIVNSITLIKK